MSSRSVGPGIRRMFLYAFSSMRASKLPVFITIAAISVVTITFLVISYFAFTLYIDSKSTVERGANKIIARCPIGSRSGEIKQFTPQQIEEIGNLSGVVYAQENLDFPVYLRLEDGNLEYSFAESTTPSDPDFTPDKMVQGGSTSSATATEIILTDSLLRKLNRSRSSKTPDKQPITTIYLEISRSQGGVVEKFNRKYYLAGVVKSRLEKAYLPVKELRHLDMLAHHLIESIPRVGENLPSPQVDIGAGRVLINDSVTAEQLKELKDYFHVNLEELFRYQQLLDGQEAWLVVTSSDQTPFSTAQVSLLNSDLGEGISLYPFATKQMNFELSKGEKLKDVNLLVVSADNPRLKKAKTTRGEPFSSILVDFRQVILNKGFAERYGLGQTYYTSLFTQEANFPSRLEVGGIAQEYFTKVDFDILCSFETLAFLDYQVKTDKACLVVISSPRTAKKLKKVYESTPLEFWEWGNTTEEISQRQVSASSETQLGKAVAAATAPLVASASTEVATTEIPAVSPTLPSPTPKPTTPLPSPLPKVTKPYWAMTLVNGDSKEVKKFMAQFNDQSIKVVELEVIPGVRVFQDKVSRGMAVAFCDSSSLKPLPFEWSKDYSFLGSRAMGSSRKFLAGADRLQVAGRELSFSRVLEPFPEGLLLISASTLSKQDLYSAPRLTEVSPTVLEVTIPDAWDYERVKKSLASKGFGIISSCQLKSQGIVCLKVESANPTSEPLDQRKLDFLAADRNILSAFSHLRLDAAIKLAEDSAGSKKIQFVNSYPQDPLRFRYQPLPYGRWLTNASSREVVLPLDFFPEIGQHPSELVGKIVFLKFDKEVAHSYVESGLKMKCKVVGVAEGNVGYLSDNTAREVVLWQSGKLHYDEASLQFAWSPEKDIYDKAGQLACKIFVGKISDVQPVVNWLENRGYLTEDSLSKQKELRKLFGSLAFLVLLTVSGGFLSGLLTVIFISLLNTNRQMPEFALLRVLGGKSSFIIWVFSFQGLMMGISSFIIALWSANALIPFIKSLMRKVFGEPITTVFTASLLSAECLSIILAAFIISVGFCLLGCWISARWACRVDIPKTLSSVE